MYCCVDKGDTNRIECYSNNCGKYSTVLQLYYGTEFKTLFGTYCDNLTSLLI